MRRYLVIDTRTKTSVAVNLEEATRITGVDSLDITWALENDGLCEAQRYTITEILVESCGCR